MYLPQVPSLHASSPASHDGLTTRVLWTLVDPLLSFATENVMVYVPGLVVSIPQYCSPTLEYTWGDPTVAFGKASQRIALKSR